MHTITLMHAESRPGPLPLAEALIEWSDPALVDAIRAEERKFSEEMLEGSGRYTINSIRTRLKRPDRMRTSPFMRDSTRRLDAAWAKLFDVFRLRVERAELFLTGTNTLSFRAEGPQPLPVERAAEFLFDPAGGAVFVGVDAYIGVMVSMHGPPAPAQEERPTVIETPRLRAGDVDALDPDTVAALLEAHADHVRNNLRVELLPPGKASPLALAASMMKHRASRGELRPSLAEETAWLADWLLKATPSYTPVGNKTLQNKLGSLYRDLVSPRRT